MLDDTRWKLMAEHTRSSTGTKTNGLPSISPAHSCDSALRNDQTLDAHGPETNRRGDMQPHREPRHNHRMPARRTLEQLGIPRATFHRWYDRFLTGGVDALKDRRPRHGRIRGNRRAPGPTPGSVPVRSHRRWGGIVRWKHCRRKRRTSRDGQAGSAVNPSAQALASR